MYSGLSDESNYPIYLCCLISHVGGFTRIHFASYAAKDTFEQHLTKMKTLHSELVPDKSMLCDGPEEENLSFYPTKC